MVTIKDIADEAGVSIATISNVVNGNMARVSKENAIRIRKIIQKRQYVPNSPARALAAKSSHIISGILIGQEPNPFKDPYYAEFFGELMLQVQERGYYLMVRRENSYEELTRNLRSWKFDGAVFIGTTEAYIKKLQEQIQIPLIFTDSYTSKKNINNVGIDDFKGGELAADYFLSHGHETLGFIGYLNKDPGKNVVSERLEGFRSRLRCSGRQLRQENTFLIDCVEEDVQRIAALLSSDQSAVTGIFTSADKLAFILIKALANLGRRVPENLSIIGFDDLSINSMMIPRLTTIRQDISKKAQIAADLLFRQIEEKESTTLNTNLNVTLVEGDTVCRR